MIFITKNTFQVGWKLFQPYYILINRILRPRTIIRSGHLSPRVLTGGDLEPEAVAALTMAAMAQVFNETIS